MGIRLSAAAPERVILASNWKCVDIFALPFFLTGTRVFTYPGACPPPCQSPRKSASKETIVSALEKS